MGVSVTAQNVHRKLGDRLHKHETSLISDTYANMEMASDNKIIKYIVG